VQAVYGWVRVRRRKGHGTVAHYRRRGGEAVTGSLAHVNNGEKQKVQIILKEKVLRVPFIPRYEHITASVEERRQDHVAAGGGSVGGEARMVGPPIRAIRRADESEEGVPKLIYITSRQIKVIAYSGVKGLLFAGRVIGYFYRRRKVGIV
jgi:hypothetical protein